MRKLLNTLYVTTENAYASLDGENVVIKVGDEIRGRFPLHILEGIYMFSYAGASPALIGKCADQGIDLVFCTPNGRFLAKPAGRTKGNVLLRREQYRMADAPERTITIARNFIVGKVINEKHVLDRTLRDHPDRIDTEDFRKAMEELNGLIRNISEADSMDRLRGLEGAAASIYFYRFDDMILRGKGTFYFHERNRRPPLDPVNAMLSYVYMMLTGMCTSALETVGLDPYVGFMHTDRPGRTSLALDLVEELRPCLADRFVLSMINNGRISGTDFEKQDSGAVILTDSGKKKLQKAWQERKQEKIEHPFLKEKIEWGLVPYAQAMLLARYVRGDLDGYPPFVWR